MTKENNRNPTNKDYVFEKVTKKHEIDHKTVVKSYSYDKFLVDLWKNKLEISEVYCQDWLDQIRRGKNKKRLNPDAQQLILEISTVDALQAAVQHANHFILRSFKLHLAMEVEQEKEVAS